MGCRTGHRQSGAAGSLRYCIRQLAARRAVCLHTAITRGISRQLLATADAIPFIVWIAQSWDGDFARWRLVTTENCWCDSSAFTAGDQTRRTTGDAVLFAGGLLAVGWY